MFAIDLFIAQLYTQPGFHGNHGKGDDVRDNYRMAKRQSTSEILRELMARRGYNQNDLAKRSRVRQQTIQRILSGESKSPRTDILRLLARALGVTLAHLTGDEPIDSAAESGDAREVIPAFPIRMLPVLSWEQAKEFCSGRKSLHELGGLGERVPVYEQGSSEAYVLEVRGDSMVNPQGDPNFPPGTRIVADPDFAATTGSYVIAQVNGSLTFKRLTEDAGQAFLQSLNPAYPMIPVTANVTICATVTAIAQRSLV